MVGHRFSVFRLFDTKESVDRCGYCNSEATSIVNGMWAYRLTGMDYQNLIDRGWRRSGHFLYKPINQKTCCPMYTIRCDVGNFHLSKSQKKILKNMNEFLFRGKPVQDLNKLKKEEWKQFLENYEGDMPAPFCNKDLYTKNDDASSKSSAQCGKDWKTSTEAEAKKTGAVPGVNGIRQDKKQKVSKETESSGTVALPGVSGIGKDISMNKAGRMDQAPRKKAKLIRQENKYFKMVSQGLSEEQVQERLNSSRVLPQSSSQIEDYIIRSDAGKNKLEVKLVRTSPKSKEYQKTERESFLLFKKYQIVVHGDKVTRLDYESFLVDSPLEASHPETGPTDGYGSFHQQYWMNGMLIAVGVIDILPYSISSVYFFYDPDFKALSLGTFGALREIFFVRNLKLSVLSIQFYYMGYYIHSCPKMTYKAHFPPSYLLCPETYTWHPIEKCLSKLDLSKYSRLEEDATIIDENELVDLQKVKVIHDGAEMSYHAYHTSNANVAEEIVQMYARLIGAKCAVNMLYLII